MLDAGGGEAVSGEGLAAASIGARLSPAAAGARGLKAGSSPAPAACAGSSATLTTAWPLATPGVPRWATGAELSGGFGVWP